MDILTPFDFVARYPERQSLVIVGNAPSLAGSGLGGWIDEHDVVARFNDARVFGHETDVGAKTSILVCNPYAETRPDRRVGDAVSPDTVVSIAPVTRRGDKSEFERWVGDYPVLFTYAPDIRIDAGDRRKLSLTTGTYGLVFLSTLLRPSALSVTGFTLFAPGSDHHYWSDQTPPGLKAHKPATEAGVFADLLNAQRLPVTVTPDVMGVFRTSGRKPGRRVREKGKRGWFGL